jgi:hypothetical protein
VTAALVSGQQATSFQQSNPSISQNKVRERQQQTNPQFTYLNELLLLLAHLSIVEVSGQLDERILTGTFVFDESFDHF